MPFSFGVVQYQHYIPATSSVCNFTTPLLQHTIATLTYIGTYYITLPTIPHKYSINATSLLHRTIIFHQSILLYTQPLERCPASNHHFVYTYKYACSLVQTNCRERRHIFTLTTIGTLACTIHETTQHSRRTTLL